MKTICEMCGKTSTNNKICSNCGAEIASQEQVAKLPTSLMWGWATFDLSKLDNHMQAVDQLRTYLTTLEQFSLLHLIDSQVDNVTAEQRLIKLLLREDYCVELALKLKKEFNTVLVHFDTIGYFSYASELNALLELS